MPIVQAASIANRVIGVSSPRPGRVHEIDEEPLR
jgi:hypothetical protein